MKALKRDINALTGREYDLVIVGGGIFGVCAAWDAALRGLSVAILEKKDFSHATSANHLKMVHGGIRYLQHGDISRVRESSRERSALLRVAPHLVKPLPIVIPTYGHGMKGRLPLRLGMLIYDLVTMDRNDGLLTERRIPLGRLISRQEILTLFPDLEVKGLTGGAIFYDGQMYNPPRLAISFLRSAVNEGADAANYAEVIGFLQRNGRICGVTVKDILSGDVFEVRSKMILNAAGSWGHRLLEYYLGMKLKPKPSFSRDLAFAIKRRFPHDYGLAFTSKSKDADSIVDRGGRHFFTAPWRQFTLVGVWHRVFDCPLEEITVTEAELQDCIFQVNSAFPGMTAKYEDITTVYTGLTLFGDDHDKTGNDLSFGKRSILIDHRKNHGLEGIITLIGVRATTARGLAERSIDLVLEHLGQNLIKCKTETTPIFGGQIDSLKGLISEAIEKRPPGATAEQAEALVYNYGSYYTRILEYVEGGAKQKLSVADDVLRRAEVSHAIQEEMANKLEDVVFRRTDLASGGSPGKAAIENCAKWMAEEMGWSNERQEQEVNEVFSHLAAPWKARLRHTPE
jgi:glycerol-3-phosphate dehydrogenase